MKKNLILGAIFCLMQFWGAAQVLDKAKVVREVDSLIQVSRILTEQKDLDQALAVNAAAEKLVLEKLGRETVAYGTVCFNHGRVLYYKKDLVEAEKWYLEAKSIQEKTLSKEHADYLLSLNNLAKLYMSMSNFGKAEQFLLDIKEIREKTSGKMNADYAENLNGLGSLYYAMGNYTKTESLFIECKDIREKILGKEHPDYARILYNLAYIYQMTGFYEKAEPYLLESREIMAKRLGKEHPDYAEILNNLGIVNYQIGKYEKAETYYIESKNIREKALGKSDYKYIQSLNNLGTLYISMGNYESAELCLLETKDKIEKSGTNDGKILPFALTNLGILYAKMGNNEAAERSFLEAKRQYEETHKESLPGYSKNLSNLSFLYQVMGKFDKAEEILIAVKKIREKSLGVDNPEYASTLLNLGQLYLDMRSFERAEPLFLESKSIIEKTMGKFNEQFADNLGNLASVYEKTGDFKKSEGLYLESQLIRDSVQGKSHPDYVKNLERLGLLYWKMNNWDKSEPLFGYCVNAKQTFLIRSLNFLSERELNIYLNKISSYQDQTLSFTQAASYRKSDIPQLCYDNILFYKGFLLNAVNQVKHLALSDSSATEKFNLLKSYERRLAAEYAKPLLERKMVPELEEQANILQKDLAHTVAGYGEAMRQVKWQEVQSTLQPGEAAVEFIHYEYYKPQSTDSTMYAALVLRSGNAEPQFIPLFEKNELKELMRGASGGSNFLKINALYSQKSLYDLIWKPLEPLLTGIKTVYCAPSGLLHRINLAAVATPEGQSYTNRRQLVLLGSTRQLVIPNSNQTGAHDAYLAGGIRYDSDSTAIAYANRGATSRSMEPVTLSFQPDSLGITRGDALDFLPATAEEVREIGQALHSVSIETKVDTGFYATEESFRQLGIGKPSPRIIHLATHGYFFPDPAVSGKKQLTVGTDPVFKTSDHPMIRSGLILAGAKQAWLTGKHPEGHEDGILTAYEISQMNLSGTELVVLSACETGLGDIIGNEGVYGLQRAFKIAGAKYLIMSLWKVDDKSTRAFMAAFYKHWLTEGQSVPQAFRSTQQEMRAKYSGAYDWAGFVLIE